jgi:hypothetical protein
MYHLPLKETLISALPMFFLGEKGKLYLRKAGIVAPQSRTFSDFSRGF